MDRSTNSQSAGKGGSKANSPKSDVEEAQQEYLEKVSSATEKFVDAMPALKSGASTADKGKKVEVRPDDESHKLFESHRKSFTGKVQEAEADFIHTMQELEGGSSVQGSTVKPVVPKLDLEGVKSSKANRQVRKEQEAKEAAVDKTRVAEVAKKAADEGRLVAEAQAKKLVEEAMRASEESKRLTAELESLKARDSENRKAAGKRWQKENLTIMVGGKPLASNEYLTEDNGSEITIKISILAPH